MASGKRIAGTILFVIALMVTLAFVFLLYAKSVNDTDVPFAQDLTTGAIVTAIALATICVILLLVFLIRSSEERRNRRLEAEAEVRAREEAERAAAFEATLTLPEQIGKGPEIVAYSLAGIPATFRSFERMNRRTKVMQYTFPRSVADAIYCIDTIAVGQGMTLKLRTLLAGPKDGMKKPVDAANLKPKPVVIDPKSIPEPLRSKLFPSEAAPAQAAPAATAPAQQEVVVAAPGRQFVAELDERLGTGSSSAASGKAYYDYPGDSHDIEDIEGIGRIYGAKLRNAGVHTTARLCWEDAGRLADEVGVPRRTVESWQHMAELVKVSGIGPQYAEAMARAGIQGIADLKRRSAEAITEQVNSYLGSLETNVLGTKITAKRVEGWQKAAGKMKKVRLKTPEK